MAKTSTTSAKIADSLHLVTLALPKTKAAPPAKPPPTHHLVIVDMSGSMWSDIPKMRDDLKRKLPKMIAEGDTFSLIGFSGKKEAFVVLEGEEIRDGKDLSQANALLDRWFKVIGLTGFKDPLVMAKDLIARVSAKRPGPFSLFFLSDGHDNQWRHDEIIAAVKDVGGAVAAATFVEYGYYADRQLLSAMAQAAGGTHIFAEDFTNYVAVLERTLGKQAPSAPRVEVDLGGDPIEGVAYALDGGDVYAYAVQGGKVSVPEHVQEIHFLSPTVIGKVKESKTDLAAHYAALGIFATRMKSKIVFPLLKDLADVEFIDTYCNCFGKQAYSAFIAMATEAAFDAKKRFKKGRDPNRLPREDAFTVLDLLDMLKEDGARLLLDSKDFSYAKIGLARVDAEGETGLKFVRTPKPEGYEIRDLTFNQERPNVSVLVRREGTIDLTSKIASFIPGSHGGGGVAAGDSISVDAEKLKKLPNPFPTHQFKNYTIVKDGLVNVRRLPAVVGGETIKKLKLLYQDGLVPFGVLEDWPTVETEREVVFDLLALPIMNRKSVAETNAKDFFTHCYDLIAMKAAQKVYNGYADKLLVKAKNQGYAFAYGSDEATFLKSVGIDQANGYQPPHTESAEKSGDFYMSKTLTGALKGLGTASKPSLPKLDDVLIGKGGAGGKLMKPIADKIENFLTSDVYGESANPQAVLHAWLESEQKAARASARRKMFGLSKMVFNVIVGQVWFSEFASLDDKSLKMKFDGVDIEATAKLEEIKIDL